MILLLGIIIGVLLTCAVLTVAQGPSDSLDAMFAASIAIGFWSCVATVPFGCWKVVELIIAGVT